MVACKALNTLVALTSLTLSLQILQSPPPFQTHKPPDHSLRFPGTFSFVLASLSALHSSFALDLPSGPSLASGHLGRLLTCRYSPLAQSPSPAISPPLDHPVNCPQGLVYLPVGTRTSPNFVHQAPAGGKEQPMVGGCRAGWFPLQHSRKPPSPQ